MLLPFYCLSLSSQILLPDKTFRLTKKKSAKYKSRNETSTLSCPYSKDTSFNTDREANAQISLKKYTDFGVFMPRSIQCESPIH